MQGGSARGKHRLLGKGLPLPGFDWFWGSLGQLIGWGWAALGEGGERTQHLFAAPLTRPE